MENKIDGKWLVCFEFKEMRKITTLDNKIDHFSCISVTKHILAVLWTLWGLCNSMWSNKGVGAFKCLWIYNEKGYICFDCYTWLYTQWSGVKIKQNKMFMKLHKTLIIKHVPGGKVMLNFSLSVYIPLKHLLFSHYNINNNNNNFHLNIINVFGIFSFLIIVHAKLPDSFLTDCT